MTAKEVLIGKCNALSFEILFATTTIRISTAMETLGLTLRQGKTVDDFKNAIRRGVRQGNGRTECQLSMVAVQLSSVLKVR